MIRVTVQIAIDLLLNQTWKLGRYGGGLHVSDCLRVVSPRERSVQGDGPERIACLINRMMSMDYATSGGAHG